VKKDHCQASNYEQMLKIKSDLIDAFAEAEALKKSMQSLSGFLNEL
jgi:hypothetical protein